MATPPVSIIVSSYNYARYLPRAIDSALQQTIPTQVIVVDDGSTDDSPAVIASYGRRVTPLLKPNAGQASSINAGFPLSTAPVVIFLDSDDRLFPNAAQAAANAFAADPSIVKVHWPLQVVDAHDAPAGYDVPGKPLSQGDLRDLVLAEGPDAHVWPPTSGNAWSRRFLQAALPVPEAQYRTCPDLYLSALVPFHGPVAALPAPHGAWRVHGHNNSYVDDDCGQRSDKLVARWDHAADALADLYRRAGAAPDVARWRDGAWYHTLQRLLHDVASAVPPGNTFILADEDQYATTPLIHGRHRLPFTERDGLYNGPPADDRAALAELHRLRNDRGASHLAIAAPCFWWLDHYPAFAAHLQSHCPQTLNTPRLKVFNLRP